MPRHRCALPMAVLVTGVALWGCQPVDAPLQGAPSPSPDAAAPGLGAPAVDMPATLADAREIGGAAAAEWQADPVLTEITVWLDGDGWTAAELTYVAADADRLLFVRLGADGLRQQRVTLATLELEPIPADDLRAVPTMPRNAREPADLSMEAADALSDCRADGPVTRVLYATGAPYAWDGSDWTTRPRWLATLVTEAGAGAVVDPVTGAATADGCVS